jgi:hypothetical protein
MTAATCPTCPTCAAGSCVRHDPLLVELRDLPGVPAGPALPVHATPAELPFWRRPRRRPRASLEAEVRRLRGVVDALASATHRAG